MKTLVNCMFYGIAVMALIALGIALGATIINAYGVMGVVWAITLCPMLTICALQYVTELFFVD